MSIDVNVQNDLVIVTESSEDITVNVSNAAGADGVGVPVGGTTGQVLKKLSNTNYDTYWALDGGGVPYSGASGSVNLGPYDLTVNELTIGKGLNGVANNTALGKRTLFHNTTGNYNTAVGHEAGHNITTGQYNTAIGQSAMFTATTAGQNTAVGVNALLLTTSGGSNVAVGLDTLQHITTGSSNTAIGYNAGSHITGGSTPNTTATNSVFIGRDSKAAADGQTNQIVIGQNAVGNGSNTATFGNTATTANYFTGSVNGGSFVKSGGTSSQFLKADGSVDSSSYVGGTGATGQVAYWNGTNSQTGSANFAWDNTNQRLTITGTNLATTTTISAICASGTFSLNNAGTHYVNTTLSTTSTQGFVSHQLTNNSSLVGSLTMYSSAEGNNIFGTSRNSAFALLNNNGTKLYIGNINATDVIFGTTNLERMRLFAGGNFAIGGTTDGGQRLQVYGDAYIKGSGATSATNALSVQNSAGTQMFSVFNNGVATVGLSNNYLSFSNNGGGTNAKIITAYWNTSTTNGIDIQTNSTTQSGVGNGFGVRITNLFNADYTTGAYNDLSIGTVYVPTSGTGTYTNLRIGSTINQTGGANGITRGLYVNPTLTAAADWRSIEWSNNSGWGLYGAGTSNNYLGGRLLIKTSTIGTFDLDVNGTARVTGATTLRGITNNDTTVILQVSQANGNGRFAVSANGQTVIGGDSFQASENFVTIARNAFNPTSGSTTHTSLFITPVINQTGGASGVTRGLLISPSLTSAADWRAIEVSAGVSVLAPSTTASATLRIPSGTAPTSPVNGDIWFDGTDLKMRIGGVTKTFTLV